MSYLFVKSKVQKNRLEVCRACEFYVSRKPAELGTCSVCSCFMHVKTWLADQKCPMDKWPVSLILDKPFKK
jgi:hypothetical protein